MEHCKIFEILKIELIMRYNKIVKIVIEKKNLERPRIKTIQLKT
jgi:hypothetical protein